MGYDRDDRRFGRDQQSAYGRPGYGQPGGGSDRGDTYGRGRPYGRDDDGRDRGGFGRERGEYGRTPPGYDRDERGFFDRASDELRSWFGDEEAERRRRYDERFDERGHERGERPGDNRYGARNQGWSNSYSGESAGLFGGRERDRSHDHDPSYRSWRDRQIEALDRDYEDYRREHQSKFDSEFAGWRGKREQQRGSLRDVKEHQEVVGSDGQHVGKVDHVRGDRILLAKNDQNAGGHHHSIPSSWIAKVGEKVEIDRTAAQALQAWKDEEQTSAIGGRSGPGGSDDRPGNLNRSFSGTY